MADHVHDDCPECLRREVARLKEELADMEAQAEAGRAQFAELLRRVKDLEAQNDNLRRALGFADHEELQRRAGALGRSNGV